MTTPLQDLTAFISSYNTEFIARLNAEPQLFKKIALDTAAHAMDLEQLSTHTDGKYRQAAVEILAVMGKGVGIIDSFADILADGNIEAIQPGKFLDLADNLPETDPLQSPELIEMIAGALQSSEDENISFSDIFYLNYLGEYLANIFNVTAIEKLSEAPELFAASRAIGENNAKTNELFTLFSDVNDVLKNSLADTYYSFGEMAEELQK